MIPGVPPGGVGGGWMWMGAGERVHPTHMHTHAHAHARAYDIIGNPWDFPKSNGGGHLHEITMFTMHACVCMHMCACVCMGGTLQPPPTPIHLPPRAAGSRKHQNSITLELIKIIRICFKILYL